MKRLTAFLATLALVTSLFLAGGTALADPNENSVVGGPGAHPHHVDLGNGDCVNIDSVLFEPAARGLHRGSNSSTPANGPFHGSC